MEKIIETRDLARNYEYGQDGGHVVEVLKKVDFSVTSGEFVCVMGKSGCGKTTLLKVLGLIDKPTDGTVLFEDKDVSSLLTDEVSDIKRREIGFVFQDFNLMDSLTVRENILLPKILDKQDLSKAEKQMEAYSKSLNIAHVLDKKPYSLSVGEKQRTAICRAIMNHPKLLLADEPTGNLDSRAGLDVMEIFKSLNKKWGITVVMVTHDIKIASYSSRVVFLKDGRLCKELKKDNCRNYLEDINKIMLEL